MQNFIKTIINAVQAWTKERIKDSVAELDTRISESQADWNQNDPNADNYVKNRTHWEENGIVHKIDEKYLPKLASTPDWNQNDPNGEGYIENRPFYTELRRSIFVEEVEVTYPEDLYTEYEPSSVVLGDTYIIVVDGVEYEGIMTSDGGFPYLSSSDNSCPVYWYDGAFSFSIFDIQDGERFIVKIIHIESDITAIPEKYIPDTIARASYFMSNRDPIGSGSFSMNRKPGTTIGGHSHTEGYYTTASGNYSHAEGYYTTAFSHSSHAEGYKTEASGSYSHAEGRMTIASGSYSHAEGKFNISDTANTHAHIVGNGASDTKRSNAHTLDWDGNAWYQGDVYVGSTSGTNKDEGSKKLATEEYVDTALEDLTTGGGFVVQAEPPEDKNVLWVDTDDESEEAENPQGGGGTGDSLDWEFINSITLDEEIISSTVEITTDANGNPFAYKELFVIVSGQAPAGKSNVFTWIPNSSWSTGESSNSIIKLPEYKTILTAQAVIMDLPDGTHFVHQYEPRRPYAESANNAPISIISDKAIWQSFIKYKWLGTFAVGTQFILYGRNKV